MEHAQAAFEGAGCEHCEPLPLRTLRSCRLLFEKGSLASVPHGSGPAAAEAQWRLQSWGSPIDLAEGFEMGPALSLQSPAGSSAFPWDLEAHVVVSSIPGEAPVLQLSGSEELDIVSMDPGDVEDSPPHTPAY